MTSINNIADQAENISVLSTKLATDAKLLAADAAVSSAHGSVVTDPFIFGLTVFVLACFVGYYVVWKVTPALHTPLMSLTNAVSGIIIVGAMIATSSAGFGLSAFGGFIAVILASINIFGGFIVTQRMLQMFKKK